MSRCSLGHPQPALPQVARGRAWTPEPGQKGEAYRGHTCCSQPALWVLNCSPSPGSSPSVLPQLLSALPPPAVPFSSSPPPGRPALPAPRPWRRPLRRAVKGRPSTCHILSAHLKILLLLAWATKKGAAPGPLAPCGPSHKRAGDKDMFQDGRCWCRIPPRVHGQKKGESGFPRAAQTCRGTSVGRAPWEGRWGQQELEGHFSAVLATEGGWLVNLHPLSPKAGPLGKSKASVLPCSNVAMRPLRILI